MPKNPDAQKMMTYFGVTDTRHIGQSPQWQAFCATCRIDPEVRYFLDAGCLVVMEADGNRWFKFGDRGPKCVRSCCSWPMRPAPKPSRTFRVGVKIIASHHVEAETKEEAEETVRGWSAESIIDEADFQIVNVEDITGE